MRGWEEIAILSRYGVGKRDRWHPLVSTSKTPYIFNRWSSGALWRLISFYWTFFETVAKSRTDEDYGSRVRRCTAVARSPLR